MMLYQSSSDTILLELKDKAQFIPFIVNVLPQN